MSDFQVLHKIFLYPEDHQPTGKTRHFRGNQEMPKPHSLEIVKYPDGLGYYLLYLDKQGNELTDTYHEQFDDAMNQAEWEFSVKPQDWQIVENEINQTAVVQLKQEETENDIVPELKLMVQRLRDKLKHSAKQ